MAAFVSLAQKAFYNYLLYHIVLSPSKRQMERQSVLWVSVGKLRARINHWVAAFHVREKVVLGLTTIEREGQDPYSIGQISRTNDFLASL